MLPCACERALRKKILEIWDSDVPACVCVCCRKSLSALQDEVALLRHRQPADGALAAMAAKLSGLDSRQSDLEAMASASMARLTTRLGSLEAELNDMKVCGQTTRVCMCQVLSDRKAFSE